MTVIDVTGVELTPYNPKKCKGNGETLDENGELIECCCDACDYFLGCFTVDFENGTVIPNTDLSAIED